MFTVAADAYGRFMGRFSEPLAEQFVAMLDPRPGQRAVDVGCGPGAVTRRLVDRLGVDAVVACDPSAPFVSSLAERLPGVEAHVAPAEHLPLPGDAVDLATAQLVVNFMADPVAGVREMARVTRPGGTVAASVWDLAGGRSPLAPFWDVVERLDPDAERESETFVVGTADGELADVFVGAGLTDVRRGELTVTVHLAGFDDWWEPYTFGVGPPGAYLASLDDGARERVRAACAESIPDEPFELSGSAWFAVGQVV